MIRVLSVNVARAAPRRIGERDVATAYAKRAVDGAVEVRALGLAGDEQADLSVHGGLAKSVYAYPHEHYAFWQTVRGQAGRHEPLQPGALGENHSLVPSERGRRDRHRGPGLGFAMGIYIGEWFSDRVRRVDHFLIGRGRRENVVVRVRLNRVVRAPHQVFVEQATGFVDVHQAGLLFCGQRIQQVF